MGIYVNKTTDRLGYQTGKGRSPFDFVFSHDGKPLPDSVACYDSPHLSSKAVCDDIGEKLEELIESAVKAILR